MPPPAGATAQHGAPATPLVAATGLVKSFPGVRALEGVDFEVRAGEVHALMGENGAGKSTLIKVLTGVHRADAGRIAILGREVRPSSPHDAERLGISTVYQEIDLVPTLSVAENVCLGRQPMRWGLIRSRALRERARAALARLGLALDLAQPLGELPLALQQMVALSRALDVDARVLVLDEPTSSLDAGEVQRLFEVLRHLRAQGLGILFVSHFLEHVYAISDRITVLRNGKWVGTWAATELPRAQLVEAMTGRALGAAPAPRAQAGAKREARPALLEFKELGKRGLLAPVSGAVARGETLGVAGLLGSGRSELAQLVFGIERPDSGTLAVDGAPLATGSVRRSIARGLAFLPEDRKSMGLVPGLSVRENIALALQARRGALRPLPAARAREIAERFIGLLGIKTPSPDAPVENLSGGNQQKVLLARWLATEPRVLILDEPTRGIDVGAKAEIEALVRALAEAGLAVLFVSSELDEIARSADRVLVLRDRAPAALLEAGEIGEDAILRAIAAPRERS